VSSWLPDDDDDSRWDSESRRCSARSFFRFAASERSSGSAALALLVDSGVAREVGGLEDCERSMLVGLWETKKGSRYHESF